MKKSNPKTTIDDLALITKKGFDEMGKKFQEVDKRFQEVDKRFQGVDKQFQGVDKQFQGVNQRLDRIEALMVTKDYLDDKLADLKGSLVVIMRKQDTKLNLLVELLRKRNILCSADLKMLNKIQVFPQLIR